MVENDKMSWRFWQKNMHPSLGFLICGLEHSGTTMVSDLFREHPLADSGFECGVLLCNTPSEFLTFEPFCRHMYVGWGIKGWPEKPQKMPPNLYSCNDLL